MEPKMALSASILVIVSLLAGCGAVEKQGMNNQ